MRFLLVNYPPLGKRIYQHHAFIDLDANQKMSRQIDAKSANAQSAGDVFIDQAQRDRQAALRFQHGG